MGKISLVIKREYTTRVKKKSFIIMTILGPILFGSLMLAPAFLAMMDSDEVRTIQVIDETNVLADAIPDSPDLKFIKTNKLVLEQAKNDYEKSDFYAILYIPRTIVEKKVNPVIYSDEDVNRDLTKHVKNALEKEIIKEKLRANGIPEDVLTIVKTEINPVNTIMKDGQEEKSLSEYKMVLGYVLGFMIYLFVFLFGSQVMRGVIEEKTNRIVEVIISSIKPFQLMMGKIIGVALVGLTQFLLWIVLTSIIVIVVQNGILSSSLSAESISPEGIEMPVSTSILDKSTGIDPQVMPDEEQMNEVLSDAMIYFERTNFTTILAAFVFFFLAGYLLYGSLFAAIGSAVDNDTDTQQFILPITIPLVLAIMVLFSVIEDPHGSLGFWFSMIPFTSPIVMVARVPFNPPLWEVLVSMGILILTFIGTTWMAGKIYRTGILMYGKKVSYKELWKWIRYKN